MNEVFNLLFCLGLYGLWRLVGWQLELRRTRVPWRKVRFLWPAIMLAWGCTIFWMLRSGITDEWLVVMYGLFVFLNAPAMLLISLMEQIAGASFHPADWQRYLLTAILIWGVNFGMILLAETRAWSNIPVTLDLGRKQSD